MKEKPLVGSRVQSTYRASWFGTVISVYKIKDSCGEHYLADILVDVDQHGNLIKKKKKHTLDIYWLKPIK